MVSAYTGAGINELFENIAKKCLGLKENETLKDSIKLSKNDTVKDEEYKQKCCYYY